MPQRRHFAAGDFLTRFPSGSPHELLIDSPLEKPGWQARADAGVNAPIFPGSTIRILDRYYEIIRIESRGTSPSRYLYYLNPWEDHFPIRTQFAYTKEDCLRLNAEAKKMRQDSSVLTLLNVFSPVVGMLPAPDQLRLQNTYGLPAIRLTLISMITTFLSGGTLMLLTVAEILSPGSLSTLPFLNLFPPLLLGLIGSAWFLESVLRVFSIKHDEPMGSFPVSFPLELFRAIRRKFDPAHKQQQFEMMEAGSASQFLNARDEVRKLKGDEIEILSILPKPDWSPITGIQFEDRWYGCAESSVSGEGKTKRYRFLLRPVPEAYAFRSTISYNTEEVRERYLKKRRLELSTWVDTFAMLWGLLDNADQKRLQKLYGFVPMKYTAYTIAAIGIFSAINVVVSLMNMRAGIGGWQQAVWLLSTALLLLESTIRFREWMKNEPSGSLLGILVRPLAAGILRGY